MAINDASTGYGVLEAPFGGIKDSGNSVKEGVIEAMACGTPVIAFDRGSMRELIEPGKTGFVVENPAAALDEEDPQRDLLAHRPDPGGGADAGGTAVSAAAVADQFEGGIQKLIVQLIKTFAETDAGSDAFVDDEGWRFC